MASIAKHLQPNHRSAEGGEAGGDEKIVVRSTSWLGFIATWHLL